MTRAALTAPDVVYVSPDRQSLVGEKYLHPAPSLIVEVISPSSVRIDRVRKRALYALFGTPEYWIVDGKTHSIERCSSPVDASFSKVETFRDGLIPSATLPGLTVDLTALFAP